MNVWGWRPDEAWYNRCDRCGQFECVCGDEAFEKWVEQEMTAQREENEQD